MRLQELTSRIYLLCGHIYGHVFRRNLLSVLTKSAVNTPEKIKGKTDRQRPKEYILKIVSMQR